MTLYPRPPAPKLKRIMELKKSDFYYDLPEELIAQDPLADRSSSRLLKLNKYVKMDSLIYR